MTVKSFMLFIVQVVVLVTIIGFVTNLPAVEQFNLNQCKQLQKELDKNRNKQRTGYRLRDADTLKDNEQRLQKQLFYHCEKPIVTQAKATVRRLLPSTRYLPFEPARRHQDEFFASTVEVKAPYQGRQLSAWLGYYQEPRFCYGVRTTSVIVECATRRQQAMQQFEQEWQRTPINLSDQP
jgi:uncharacterized membrane protein (DUF106 family)